MHMNHVARKLVFGVLTGSDTNGHVDPYKKAESLKFRFKKKDCSIFVAKPKMLTSCSVTAQLICDFTFEKSKDMKYFFYQIHRF